MHRNYIVQFTKNTFLSLDNMSRFQELLSNNP